MHGYSLIINHVSVEQKEKMPGHFQKPKNRKRKSEISGKMEAVVRDTRQKKGAVFNMLAYRCCNIRL